MYLAISPIENEQAQTKHGPLPSDLSSTRLSPILRSSSKTPQKRRRVQVCMNLNTERQSSETLSCGRRLRGAKLLWPEQRAPAGTNLLFPSLHLKSPSSCCHIPHPCSWLVISPAVLVPATSDHGEGRGDRRKGRRARLHRLAWSGGRGLLAVPVPFLLLLFQCRLHDDDHHQCHSCCGGVSYLRLLPGPGSRLSPHVKLRRPRAVPWWWCRLWLPVPRRWSGSDSGGCSAEVQPNHRVLLLHLLHVVLAARNNNLGHLQPKATGFQGASSVLRQSLVATASLIVVLRLRKKPDGFLHCQAMNHQWFSLQVLYYTPK